MAAAAGTAAAAATLAGLHDSAARGFTASVASTYERGRPDWTDAFVASLLVERLGLPAAGPLLIVEVAVGTGKFTRPLLRWARARARAAEGATATIWLVEPTDMMALTASELASGDGVTVHMVRARADGLVAAGVPVGAADAVIAAQAFHWFADAESVAELARVLKPGAPLALVWNHRDHMEATWAVRLEALLDTVYDDTPRAATLAWKPAIETAAEFTGFTHERLRREPHVSTADGVVDWLRSISVVNKLDEARKAAFVAEARAILSECVAGAAATPEPTITVGGDGVTHFAMPMYVDVAVARRRA